MSERKVMRVTNPMVLAMPEIHGLFQRSFETGKLDAPWSFEAAMEMGDWINNPQHGVFIGLENGEPVGYVIGVLPSSKLIPIPAVYMIYNEGSQWMARELSRVVIDFFREAGYNSAWLINRMTPNEGIFERWVRHVAKSEPVGSIVRLDFE